MSDNWVETETLKHELHIARDALEWTERERDEWKKKHDEMVDMWIELNNGDYAQACEDRNEYKRQRDKLIDALNWIRGRGDAEVSRLAYEALAGLEKE